MPRPRSVRVINLVPLPDQELDAIRAVPQVELVSLADPTGGESVGDVLDSSAEVLISFGRVPDPTRLPMLRWHHVASAGTEHLNLAQEPPAYLITKSSGVAAGAIAAHMMAGLLALYQRLDWHLLNKGNARWPPDEELVRHGAMSLHGRTVLMVGYGSNARELARLLQPWRPNIVAVKKSPEQREDRGYRPNGLGDPAGSFPASWHGIADLGAVAAQADVVAVTVPLTGETRHLIDADIVGRLPDGALLINTARGAVLEDSAVVDALRSGRLAGAALDVFDPEPLPRDHPYWSLDNVILTPHVADLSADSAVWARHLSALVIENLRRYTRGKPLMNVVDPRRGY